MPPIVLAAVIAAAPPVEVATGTSTVLSVKGIAVNRSPARVSVQALDGGQVLVTGVSDAIVEVGRTKVKIKVLNREARLRDWRARLAAIEPKAFSDLDSMGCLWVECPSCTAEEHSRLEPFTALEPCVRSVDPITPPRPAIEVLKIVQAELGDADDELLLEVRGGRAVLVGRVSAAMKDKLERVGKLAPELVIHVEQR